MEAPAPHAGKNAKVDAGPNRPLRPAVRAAFVLWQISDVVKLRLRGIEINFIFAVLLPKLGGPHLYLVFALLATHVVKLGDEIVDVFRFICLIEMLHSTMTFFVERAQAGTTTFTCVAERYALKIPEGLFLTELSWGSNF